MPPGKRSAWRGNQRPNFKEPEIKKGGSRKLIETYFLDSPHVVAAVSAIYQFSYASTLPDNIANPITIITPMPLKIKFIRSIGSIILVPPFTDLLIAS